MSGWASRFTGLPYEDFGRTAAGADCWGLAYVVYQEELSITLPDYLGYSSVDEAGEVSALIEGAKSHPLWVPIKGPAVAFDIAVFRRGRLSRHVGLVVRRGLMLHMVDRDCAKLERYDQGRWKNRLTGVWRHVDLISKGGAT